MLSRGLTLFTKISILHAVYPLTINGPETIAGPQVPISNIFTAPLKYVRRTIDTYTKISSLISDSLY